VVTLPKSYAVLLQVLTPMQEARARVIAYPKSLSLWYLADYLERVRTRDAASLQVHRSP